MFPSSTTTTPVRRSGRRIAALAAGALLALSAAGCATNGGTDPGAAATTEAQSADSPITVWVDATRAPAAEAFQKANPDIPIKVETYDGSSGGSNSFKTKMALFDQSGSGWPDVVFSSQNNDASWASQSQGGKQAFAADLSSGVVPKETLDQFTKGSLDVCTVDGKVYCLRNDLAQEVLWYDKSLMDQFGYQVPKTWEEYQALGQKVAKEHPGYIIGGAGDSFDGQIYMWSAKCEAGKLDSATSISVDVTSDQCKAAASLLDDGIKNKYLSTVSVFTPEFVQQYSGKVLMLPGPAWYGGALFNNPESLNIPKGQMGIGDPMAWGSGPAVTGNVGGGTWFVSSHSRNTEAASKFVQFVTTDDSYQVDQAPGYPAYAPAAEKWLAKQAASGYYATSMDALTNAAPLVWSDWSAPSFSQESVWSKTVTPVITSGGSVLDTLPTWQTAIENEAKVNGYTVK
ncbi:ABC transporter substrate-binding protein [Quadrisphaera setariae]|uniref:Extracellular solute-binding protein n=1 Tax=Quadrisphaera setariae TaxID=2593304 RepID=A0A5C8Z7Y3_9ACTN|nr:extracellular solute-binding protein [Quadrisphaera setariae]TXR52956.1 extracellular solute-binding protein [Quadrisphaera setariae]